MAESNVTDNRQKPIVERRPAVPSSSGIEELSALAVGQSVELEFVDSTGTKGVVKRVQRFTLTVLEPTGALALIYKSSLKMIRVRTAPPREAKSVVKNGVRHAVIQTTVVEEKEP